MILLYNDLATDSTLATPARVEKEAVPSRRYQAEGHYLVIDGPGHIVAYDAQEICKIPGWRMATAAEQNQYAAMKRKAARLVEAVPPPVPAAPVEVPAPVAEPAKEEAPAEEPPAASEVVPPPSSQVLTTATAPKAAGGKG